MTYKVRPLEGTGLVELYQGTKSVAGPFTPAEAEAWVEAQLANPRDEVVDEPPTEIDPVGIL